MPNPLHESVAHLSTPRPLEKVMAETHERRTEEAKDYLEALAERIRAAFHLTDLSDYRSTIGRVLNVGQIERDQAIEALEEAATRFSRNQVLDEKDIETILAGRITEVSDAAQEVEASDIDQEIEAEGEMRPAA